MINLKQLLDPIVNEVPNRIVFTGGPLAGKSTVMEYLEGAYGDKARFMTEVASMLLTSGYPKPGSDVMFSEEWLNYINETIIPTQMAMENGHLHAAAEGNKRAVFFDRGLLDPAAYLPEGHQTMVDRYGMDIKAAYNRYSMVIHMQTLACASIDKYNQLCSTNPARYDTAEMAIERDKSLVEAWKGHPNWIFLPATDSLDSKLDKILKLVNPMLDVEIERKFHLTMVPDGVIAMAPRKKIKQFYILRESNVEMRVRSYDDNLFELCVKDNGTWKRMEWETKMPAQVFNALVADGSLPSVSKTRYYIPHGSSTIELDVYDDRELCLLECEFSNEIEAKAFVLPDWAVGAHEVTDDPKFKNAALAYS